VSPIAYFEREARRATAEFKDHQAAMLTTDGNHVTLIEWRKPGTSINSVSFILKGRYLCVIGDLGDAVFAWSEIITPAFLASCDWHYMKGKCQCSPHGSKFESWDDEMAKAWADKAADEFHSEQRDCPEWLTRLSDSNNLKEDFESIAREVYDDTGEAEEARDIANAGMVPDYHYICHYIGLQMALAQLGFGASSRKTP
jgi:hypothetical protein